MQQLVDLIIEGFMSKSVAEKQTASSISQLLKFSSVKTKIRKVEVKILHSKSLETTLLVATGFF